MGYETSFSSIALSTYYSPSRFGDRSYRWIAYGRRELRFPTTFKAHQLTLDKALYVLSF